jgi:diguanylate cyclase (GGDEF)-like protein
MHEFQGQDMAADSIGLQGRGGSDPVHGALEVDQAELKGFARSVTEVEWLLMILVLLFLFVTDQPTVHREIIILTLVAFAGFILLFRYSGLLKRQTRFKLGLEALAMVAFLTAVLSQTGGAQSPLINLYLLPIITAALTLGKEATVLVVTLVCACYLMLATWAGGVDALSLGFVAEAMGTLLPFLLVAFLTTLLAENMHTAKHRIRALSDRDELTGLYNMRAFTQVVQREHELAARSDRRYSILMIDIDNLKAINDDFGHTAGNRAIALVADSLLRVTRGTDVVARYGGDEFMVFLGDADQYAADEVAQRVRNVVFASTLEVGDSMQRISANVGVAVFPGGGEACEDVINAAGRAMYKDKKRHRVANRNFQAVTI